MQINHNLPRGYIHVPARKDGSTRKLLLSENERLILAGIAGEVSALNMTEGKWVEYISKIDNPKIVNILENIDPNRDYSLTLGDNGFASILREYENQRGVESFEERLIKVNTFHDALTTAPFALRVWLLAKFGLEDFGMLEKLVDTAFSAYVNAMEPDGEDLESMFGEMNLWGEDIG